MRRIFFYSMFVGVFFCGAAVSHAVSFSAMETFKKERGVLVNDRTGFSSPLEVFFDADSTLQLNSASLFITYAGVGHSDKGAMWKRELWTVNVSGSNGSDSPYKFSAQLAPHQGNKAFVTEELLLPKEILNGGPWTFTVSFDESTSGRDKFRLKRIGLSGDYSNDSGGDPGGGSHETNPVPEPSTILLLGFGLAGFVGLKRGKIFKADPS